MAALTYVVNALDLSRNEDISCVIQTASEEESLARILVIQTEKGRKLTYQFT